MELERESGWQLHPIGGDTGQAYMGTKNEERLFLKRNSSPFLAALSLEGISPRLVWTKRIGNGDVLTAQEWCSGRTLYRDEMTSSEVFYIIQKVHRSQSLKRMLHRLGGSVFNPLDLYQDCFYNLTPDMRNHPLIDQALTFLRNTLPGETAIDETVVCHGDISHKNFLLSNEEQLYLVDWDSALLADPLYDISQLLERYISPKEWDEWLSAHRFDEQAFSRGKLNWYIIINTVKDINSNHIKQDYSRMNHDLVKLNTILSAIRF